MKNKQCFGATVVGMVMALSALIMGSAQAEDKAREIKKSWSFEETDVSQLQEGWKIEATNQKGPLATWQVIEDKTAPSGKRVLAMTSPNHKFGGTFNICWTDRVPFQDGEIEVRFKAVSGREDQGGGPMWRVQDKDNYYIARANPLENNFRVYKVVDGKRKKLASAKLNVTDKEWHSIKIKNHGAHIECFYNGKKYLDVEDDTFQKGKIGLWTKADAVTYFDDVTVRGK